MVDITYFVFLFVEKPKELLLSTKCDIFSGKFHLNEEMYFQIYITCSRYRYNEVQVSICYHEALIPKSRFRIFTDHHKFNEWNQELDLNGLRN